MLTPEQIERVNKAARRKNKKKLERNKLKRHAELRLAELEFKTGKTQEELLYSEKEKKEKLKKTAQKMLEAENKRLARLYWEGKLQVLPVNLRPSNLTKD